MSTNVTAGTMEMAGMGQTMKNSLIELVPNLCEMSELSQEKIMEQLPEFISCISNGMGNSFYEAVLKEDTKSMEQCYDAFSKIISAIHHLSEKDTLSENERKFCVEKLMEMADKVSEKDRESKVLKSQALNTVGGNIIGVLVVGGTAWSIKNIL